MKAASRIVAATPLGAGAPAARADAPARARRVAARLESEWLARATWTISRTGRPGLVGIALLLAAALFLISTHLVVVGEVQAMRTDLATALSRARTAAVETAADPAIAVRALPARSEVPAILRQLFGEAARAGLAVDTAKYEVAATKSSGVVRHQIAFPVTGAYPQVRAFIDATLATMPAVALRDLAFERKTIADGSVEATIRMTVYTRSGP